MGATIRRVIWGLVVVVVAAAAAGAALAQPKPGEQIDPAIIDALATDLLRTLKPPARIAIRPLQPEEAAISPVVAARVNDALGNALLRLSNNRLGFVAREALQRVWDEATEFQSSAFAKLLTDAGADILVDGRMTPVRGGIELSFKAYRVGGGLVGTIEASSELRVLPLDVEAAAVQSLRPAVRAAAQGHLSQLRRLNLAGTGRQMQLQQIGERSEFGDYASELFIEDFDRLGSEMSQRREGQQAIAGDPTAQERQTRLSRLQLRTTVRDLDKVVGVTFTLEGADGFVLRQSVSVDSGSIPAKFLPLSRGGVRVATGLYGAGGEAVVGPTLAKDEAMAGARALARARVIAQGIGEPAPGIEVVRDVDDAAKLIAYLSKGISYQEEWQQDRIDGDGRVVVTLRAKVKKVGGGSEPPVTARIDPPIVRAGEAMTVSLDVQQKAYLGIFAWQADGTVVRMYPYESGKELTAEPGRPMVLPRRGDPVFASAPMPGAKANHEAVVIVASAVPFDFTKLAPAAAQTAAGSLQTAIKASIFLDGLAERDTSALGIRFLPYQVVAN